ncbi:MAG: Membrane-fusion protein [Proteobacteria bacterium]|nr:Membrane-fusion protein [Pseudomonadota bacterium]
MMRNVMLSAVLVLAMPAIGATPNSVAGPQAISPQETNALTDKEGRIRTQFAAHNQVVLSSELSAKIARLPLREGESFRAGQTLVEFDCSLFQSQLNKSRAIFEAAQQTLTVNQRLRELNSIGTLELQQAEAKVKESGAEVAFNQAMVKKCSIAAPFAGRMVKRMVAAHQYVTPGTPLLDIQDAGALDLQLIVPSRWLPWLKPGTRFTVLVDELGKSINARVVRIGARIDPISQSVNLIGNAEESAAQILPGMSGWAQFAAPAK